MKTNENTHKFKGELVEESTDRYLTGDNKMLKNNPYKTPPNNITSKKPNMEDKG